jgi:hypothetical protein
MNTWKKSSKIIGAWPIAVVALGIALTLVWSGLLAWYLLRLLQIV